ncbi:MAG: hypothetical protein D6732_26040 [Methanobacteriota archaeon]|nr:MAG: hypothetical protein D6732_26040 [Euryarchaeota archaeon]
MMNLKIIARCGCGECPTVLFGETFDNHPITHGQEVAHYTGNTSTGKKVGIVLMAVNNHLTELEAYDPTGEGVKGWPELDTLQKI